MLWVLERAIEVGRGGVGLSWVELSKQAVNCWEQRRESDVCALGECALSYLINTADQSPTRAGPPHRTHSISEIRCSGLCGSAKCGSGAGVGAVCGLAALWVIGAGLSGGLRKRGWLGHWYMGE